MKKNTQRKQTAAAAAAAGTSFLIDLIHSYISYLFNVPINQIFFLYDSEVAKKNQTRRKFDRLVHEISNLYNYE